MEARNRKRSRKADEAAEHAAQQLAAQGEAGAALTLSIASQGPAASLDTSVASFGAESGISPYASAPPSVPPCEGPPSEEPSSLGACHSSAWLVPPVTYIRVLFMSAKNC